MLAFYISRWVEVNSTSFVTSPDVTYFSSSSGICLLRSLFAGCCTPWTERLPAVSLYRQLSEARLDFTSFTNCHRGRDKKEYVLAGLRDGAPAWMW